MRAFSKSASARAISAWRASTCAVSESLIAEAWRIHFHVPVHPERMGPLRTTRNELRQALATIAELDYAPHLEVETYTWEVLPGNDTPSAAPMPVVAMLDGGEVHVVPSAVVS